ncbi:MAG TPA: non-canonical purine NTP diphosphatase [Bacteroidia bacterium]|nr:non-canonical purine NTP diphosphatase [Bacteroidia bacterium]
MKLVFATHNKNKLQEIQLLLPKSMELISLSDLNVTEEIPETADTLKGNALLKAKYVYDKFKLNCFADDSGLEVEALGGAPGVYSARYAGPAQVAADNMQKLLSELKGKTNRKACFKTVISLLLNGRECFFEGKIDGKVTNEQQGTQGFGYDPVFMPDGYNVTFARMEISQKNKISHRALAVNKLVDFLKNQPL